MTTDLVADSPFAALDFSTLSIISPEVALQRPIADLIAEPLHTGSLASIDQDGKKGYQAVLHACLWTLHGQGSPSQTDERLRHANRSPLSRRHQPVQQCAQIIQVSGWKVSAHRHQGGGLIAIPVQQAR